MFLKSLKIENGSQLIREIPFHKGLNLIIDETTKRERDSGNNVGKTTVLRLIHYCLGGDGKNIYTDTEFKGTSNNTQIEKFLTENDVIVSLKLIESFEDERSSEIEIKRNFLKSSKKIIEINGESILTKDFDSKLKELIFDSTASKPTFKQIVAKNIRDEKNRLIHTVKVLSAYTTKEEYETLYLFWLGISTDALDKKHKLQRQKRIEENLRQRLKKEGTLAQIEQSLAVLNRSIDELSKRKNDFNVNPSYEQDIESLNRVKYEISSAYIELSRLELRKTLILESKADLEKNISTIDTAQLKALYTKANKYIANLQTSFQETLLFHNQMVNEKIRFITNELPNVETQISSLKSNLSALSAQETNYAKKLKKTGAVEELQTLIFELNIAHEKKGQLEEQKRQWHRSNETLDKISREINDINDGIKSKDELIDERIGVFNQYFSDISYQLYGERFVLSPEKGERGYELNVTSLTGNLGTGKKKGQIAAFDFAYIQFADFINIDCLHFVLHDQIENIHDNQINAIITSVVNSINCQYVVPVLKDKLPPEINADHFQVVKLSQSDKLFRI